MYMTVNVNLNKRMTVEHITW